MWRDMMKDNIRDAINHQLNREFYSGYLYLSMATYFESINLKGFANWMKVQAKEEEGHAMKMFNHLVERGARVILEPIEAPPSDWKTPQDAFEHTYKHEQNVTGLINNLVDLAKSEKDNATEIFLQWFVKEQVEEEDSSSSILEQLKLIGESGSALLMLDYELGKRESSS
jgi:ferritin